MVGRYLPEYGMVASQKTIFFTVFFFSSEDFDFNFGRDYHGLYVIREVVESKHIGLAAATFLLFLTTHCQ
jgi:hypothetical protein